jgi:hypothetical protein
VTNLLRRLFGRKHYVTGGGMSDALNDETLSDRGFHHWEPIRLVAGRGDDSDDVRFYESSGAAAIRGTIDAPQIISGPFAWLSVGGNAAHMTRVEVVQLQGYIERWLVLNPEDEDTTETEGTP